MSVVGISYLQLYWILEKITKTMATLASATTRMTVAGSIQIRESGMITSFVFSDS